jgi:nucleotide-binding universal stress UspA family protein
MRPVKRILMPTDFSAGADAAAKVAAALAEELSAAVDVVTVVDTSAFAEIYGDAVYRAQRIADIHGEAKRDAEQFADRHFRGISGVKASVRDGNTFLELLQAAKELGSDMIVMGTHGRTGLAHLIIGSVAEKVVRASPIPVLTVRASR